LKFTLDAKGAVFSSPALAGEMVYAGVSNGRLLAIDAKAGKLLWDFQTEGSKRDPLKMLKPDGGLNNEAIYARYLVITRTWCWRLYGCSLVFTSR